MEISIDYGTTASSLACSTSSPMSGASGPRSSSSPLPPRPSSASSGIPSFFRRRKGRSVISLPVAACSNDDSCSCSSDDDADEDDDEDKDEELLSSSGKYECEYEPAWGSDIYGDDDRGQDCNSGSRPFWPELSLGGAMVKTWEGLGLGLDRSAGGLISLPYLNREEVLRSLLRRSLGTLYIK